MNTFTFEQQAKFFEKKLNLKTDSYLDVLGEEHDYFFMVAGANRNEVLLAFREAVDAAIENGETLEQFRSRFDEIVAQTGWDYNGGRNWRSRIIYDTNVYGSYNRGRLMQHLELAEAMPYWEYQHNECLHPRPEHEDWDGLVLRYDDPWWRYHYPIKAYGCHCTVVAHDEDDLQTYGKRLQTAPPVEMETKIVGTRSGNPRKVTKAKGTDVGFKPWDFGKIKSGRVETIDQILFNKMVAASQKTDISNQFLSRLTSNVLDNPNALNLLNQSMASMVEQVVGNKVSKGVTKTVGAIPVQVLDKLDSLKKTPQTPFIAVRDEDILHALRDSKQAKEINLPVEFWQNLPEKLRKPKAILLQPNTSKNGKAEKDSLLFIYDTDKGKVAIIMDYDVKLKDPKTGKKVNAQVNMVRTASVINGELDWLNLKNSFELLWGSLD
ncbi:phage head morphogenesis protein [Lonepinella koalarum]|uniref:Phage Mu protein F like protein n=1 Tax=Lonepinella koalarum TaxID=53417 RepID=A0A4R1KKS7_9PAST|nr:phage minor head protein [Lonepinella koalarum]MDH2927345.1 phage head morphogenesis protein [Lonepinella koalarum]TCK64923.1 phage Mu protein F like protein [Lonepinella koalarum]TFJ88818.1 phage head morphogenesis protein [Lonepinella koalarum]